MPAVNFETPGWKHWKVPDKVEWVDIIVDGAGSNGRRGGQVKGKIRVKNISALYVLVGEAGKSPKGPTGGGPTIGGGGGGGDGAGKSGGWSGGGATIVRANSRTGPLHVVAAGAGGDSGDGTRGGGGGPDQGEAGFLSDENSNLAGTATGGTQTQGGNGGTSEVTAIAGTSAGNHTLDRGGRGGNARSSGHGGGGGGGGYRGGGGGTASMPSQSIPSGGGGGGSNYRGGVVGYSTLRAMGSRDDGRIQISWVAPSPANQPPAPPTDVKVNGKAAVAEMATLAKHQVKITAKLGDPDNKQKLRMVLIYSPDPDFRRQAKQVASDWIEVGTTDKKKRKSQRAAITLTGLRQDTLYHCRLYARDHAGLLSTNYKTLTFWTNRRPKAPKLVMPSDGSSVTELDSVTFAWQHTDPDEPQSPQQGGFHLRWRRAGTPIRKPGPWHDVTKETYQETFVINPGLGANTHYEWRVRTHDNQGLWGPWSITRTFFVSGVVTPPALTYPTDDEAVDVTQEVTLDWAFTDRHAGNGQANADVRYRAVGATDWVTLLGTPQTPGSETGWALPALTFQPGFQYEWQARVLEATTAALSAWSESETFWGIRGVGGGEAPALPVGEAVLGGSLGCGQNVVHVYDRGGLVWWGEIGPLQQLAYNRVRDDISNCLLVTNGYGDDCAALLSTIDCWTHELVVFRDGKRVWEGPITRIEERVDGVEIEAKDVMGYVYRRILRQGYNDAYRIVDNVQVGMRSVVERAALIVRNALAYDDPNLLPYLTTLDYPDDAMEARSVPPYSKTAWEEVDDLAAHAGLDYTCIGRRILFWDTHRPVGRLPEMRAENFSSPPVVSTYGMLTATDFAMTNNAGVYGIATRPRGRYGPVEQIASAYGEDESNGGSSETLTRAGRDALEQVLTEQAKRSIAARYPTPVVVRVPDNSQLNPETGVDFNHLVPGVWIPLRATGTIRKISQWQKLDAVRVEATSQGEKVMVTMSPAPNSGYDPDEEASLEAEA